ncbi:hypothetical protein COCNU_11G012200 [Cocos nucifera]|uniref:Uncharacterized protein n=1 Tax=Cocos nucifera TaxID=13894 RepID=A0A8K0IQQ2_COCNU|nr:hypothetical protein COCNU_11G012200 [Cocos nucifera]
MQQKTAQTEDNRRLPLVPSEKNNAGPATRKLRSREIASRYKSGISSTPPSAPTTPRRGPLSGAGCPSPMLGTSLPKRSQSADRRRPSTPSARSSVPSSPSSRPSTPSSPSSRSTTPVHDVSESVSVPSSKRDKAVTSFSSDRTLKSSANVAAERKRTPLRGRNTSEQSENSKPLENSQARVMDQHRWPAMIGGKNILYNVWNATSKLCDFVIMKRIDVQHWRQEMKLAMILKEQMAYLENWAVLEREHCNSLSGATEALKASTLCLPVTGGARADMLSMKNAVSSAVDVMQTMGSSICYLLSKVEGTKALVSELSGVAAKERAMLDECRELLASAAAMQGTKRATTKAIITQQFGVGLQFVFRHNIPQMGIGDDLLSVECD